MPDVVKLDLEGSELLAVCGATEWLKCERPPAWIIEHNPSAERRAGYLPGDIWREAQAYRPCTCRFIGGRRFRSPEELDDYPRQGNLLITPA
jgi:hypothetical protein